MLIHAMHGHLKSLPAKIFSTIRSNTPDTHNLTFILRRHSVITYREVHRLHSICALHFTRIAQLRHQSHVLCVCRYILLTFVVLHAKSQVVPHYTRRKDFKKM